MRWLVETDGEPDGRTRSGVSFSGWQVEYGTAIDPAILQPAMHITDIPVEVFLDNLFPLAEVHDVLSLGSANKFFAALSADETFWRRRCSADFNFTSQETARQSGWKNLYRGLNHPRVFVWGYVVSSGLSTDLRL